MEQTTIENFGSEAAGNANISALQSDTDDEALQFTGNWFIDAGILGFVNLMEEVYGWDLETLKKEVKNTKYVERKFIYAFWYKTIYDTVLRWIQRDNFNVRKLKSKYNMDSKKLKERIEIDFKKFIYNLNENSKKQLDKNKDVYGIILELNEEIKVKIENEFMKYKDALKKQYASNKKNIVQNSKDIGLIAYHEFFTNLSFFNSSTNKHGKEEKVLKLFDKLIHEYFVRKDKKIKGLPVEIFDKGLSPFIYPASDFSNIYYGQPPTLSTLQKISSINPLYYLLSFSESFTWVRGKRYMFYTPSLEISYSINKELNARISQLQKDTNTEFSFFEVTWQTVLDKIIEYKSLFQLEEMYIIEYSGISNQQIADVEYIGISKLQAEVILDDTIRSNLNLVVPVREIKSQNYDWKWILEEFLKKNSLYSLAVGHGNLVANGKIYLSKNAIIYSLAAESTITKFKEKREEIFSPSFFEKYEMLKEVPLEIKKKASLMFRISSVMSKVFSQEITENKNFVFELFTPLKKRDRKIFVNTVLKNLINKGESKEIVHYLFENILSNDETWEYYALPMVIGLIPRGGENNG